MNIIRRLFDLNLSPGKSAFLWGPLKVGKSHWIHSHLKNNPIIDLLQTDIFVEYASKPSLLRERFSDEKKLIVIDEIQKVPDLLNEVHWLIENKKKSFLLTGSSARKLKRGQANLLGGRAWRRLMTPLSFFETEGFDIEQIMISGLLPSHFLSKYPKEELRSYLADYLKEEIANEAAVHSIPTFSDFLKTAALTSGELINYANIGRECGVSPKVVRDYVDILEDTYLGFRISPWKKSRNRRLIETEKFYLFDVGVSNFLSRREPKLGTPEFGKSFEHYILMELKAYQAYRDQELEIRYWRTSTGQEVDFILGEKDLAIEIKASSRTHETDTRSLEALKDDGNIKKAVLISFESQRKILNGWIEVLPWKDFLQKLWNGDFV